MRYVNSLKLFISVNIFAVLAACGGATPVKKSLVDESTPRDLESTIEFIPVTQNDKEGNQLPYVPAANPYIQQRGKIKKQSAFTFIEAKRAFSSKDYKRAESLLDQVIESDRHLSGPWVLKGHVSRDQGAHDKAAEFYARAIEINAKNVNAYLHLALSQREQGKFLPAQNTYAEALKIWKDFPEAHLNLAILYDLYLNHPIRAQKHFEAYQFLTGEEDVEVGRWLSEVKARTGIVTTLKSQVAANGEVIKPGGVTN